MGKAIPIPNNVRTGVGVPISNYFNTKIPHEQSRQFGSNVIALDAIALLLDNVPLVLDA